MISENAIALARRALNAEFERATGKNIAEQLAEIMTRAALTAALSDQVVVPKAVLDIIAERKRQVEVKGFDVAHDDAHSDGSLAAAAAVYALGAQTALIDDHRSRNGGKIQVYPTAFWRWSLRRWKPKDQRHNLVISGALIVADIERLDRLSAPPPSSTAGEGKS